MRLAGNEISKCDTSSADYQSEVAGLVDGVGSEDRDSRTDPYTREHFFRQITKMIFLMTECTDDLNRVCSDLANAAEDTAIALADRSQMIM